jgi:hypothetical protein
MMGWLCLLSHATVFPLPDGLLCRLDGVVLDCNPLVKENWISSNGTPGPLLLPCKSHMIKQLSEAGVPGRVAGILGGGCPVHMSKKFSPEN